MPLMLDPRTVLLLIIYTILLMTSDLGNTQLLLIALTVVSLLVRSLLRYVVISAYIVRERFVAISNNFTKRKRRHSACATPC